MDPLSLTGSITALISITTQVFSYLNDVKNTVKEREELESEVANLLPLLSKLKSRAKNAEETRDKWYESSRTLLGGANGPLDQFSKALEELAGKLAPATGLKEFARNLTWTFEKKNCIDILAKIERLKTLIGYALQEEISELAQAIKTDTAGIPALSSRVAELTEGVEELQLSKNAKLRHTIIEWLSPLNFLTTQDDIFSRGQTGTGQWLLESAEFEDWRSGSGRVLWCPGIPGAGKTVLASIIVNQLRKQFKNERNVRIACIYCNYKEKDVQTPVNLIASLWMQLVQESSSISDVAENLYTNHVDKGTRPTLNEVSKVLRSELSRYSKVFIVVDALDECPKENQYRSTLLMELRALQPMVNLMVTSRFLDNIEREFEGITRLEISASFEDVKAYVTRRISCEDQLSRYVSKDPTLKEDIIKTVVGSAQRMFLLAQLHMDSLATKRTCKAVRKGLKTLPKELDGTYQEAMRRIESQNDDDKQLAERVLFWISYALRPLTLNELQHALAVEFCESELDEENIPDEELLTSLCAGLVIVDKQSNVVRLVHYTTEEYFERIREDRFPTAQTEIAKTCLTYLSFKVFADGYCQSDKEMEVRLHQNPFLQYAAQNWGDHVRLCPEQLIMDQILEFLAKDSNISCFVQAMQIPKYRWEGYSQRPPKFAPALCAAAYFGLKETVRLLLEKGADIEAKTSGGWTALHCAAYSGHEAVMRLLLEKGADAEVKTSGGWTTLHCAANSGHEAVVRLLLEKGADIKAKDADGSTALHCAANSGHCAVVRLLLEKGADIEAKDAGGWTALHCAANNGHEAVVRLLEIAN